MKKELELKKGNILNVAKEYKKKKILEKYLLYINDLLDFKEELKEYEEGIKEVRKYVDKLLKRLNNMEVSKEEAEDNFVKFIKEYDVSEWKKIIKSLK